MASVECEGKGQYSGHEKEHIGICNKCPFTDAYRVIKLEIIFDN